MASSMGNRTINPNALAVRYSLQSDIKLLREAAFAHVEAAIREHDGASTKIAEALGVSRDTYSNWLNDYARLLKAHEKAKGGRKVRGPKRGSG